MGRYGEIWGDMGRYGEVWGDTGRYGEIRGEIPLLGAGVLAVKDVEASDLRHAAVQLRVDESVREPVAVCKFDGPAHRRIRPLAHLWACIISSTVSYAVFRHRRIGVVAVTVHLWSHPLFVPYR